MPVDLFAVLRVADYEAARDWYERLLGKPPTFLAHATEAVWELIYRDADGNEIGFAA
jgi:catechol 2,3-dioxygenase-like lactoylglutathione lyase family enzyme